MKIEIYRKRYVLDTYFMDDEPTSVFCNVSQVEIGKGIIYGNMNGEELAIKLDHMNYDYIII